MKKGHETCCKFERYWWTVYALVTAIFNPSSRRNIGNKRTFTCKIIPNGLPHEVQALTAQLELIRRLIMAYQVMQEG